MLLVSLRFDLISYWAIKFDTIKRKVIIFLCESSLSYTSLSGIWWAIRPKKTLYIHTHRGIEKEIVLQQLCYLMKTRCWWAKNRGVIAITMINYTWGFRWGMLVIQEQTFRRMILYLSFCTSVMTSYSVSVLAFSCTVSVWEQYNACSLLHNHAHYILYITETRGRQTCTQKWGHFCHSIFKTPFITHSCNSNSLHKKDNIWIWIKWQC